MGVQTWAEAGEVMVRQWIGYAGPKLEIRYSMISYLQIFRFVADPPESVFGVQHFFVRGCKRSFFLPPDTRGHACLGPCALGNITGVWRSKKKSPCAISVIRISFFYLPKTCRIKKE